MLALSDETRSKMKDEWMLLILEMDAVMRVCHATQTKIETRPRGESFRGSSFIVEKTRRRRKAPADIYRDTSAPSESKACLGYYRLPVRCNAYASKEAKGTTLMNPLILRKIMRHPAWPDPDCSLIFQPTPEGSEASNTGKIKASKKKAVKLHKSISVHETKNTAQTEHKSASTSTSVQRSGGGVAFTIEFDGKKPRSKPPQRIALSTRNRVPAGINSAQSSSPIPSYQRPRRNSSAQYSNKNDSSNPKHTQRSLSASQAGPTQNIPLNMSLNPTKNWSRKHRSVEASNAQQPNNLFVSRNTNENIVRQPESQSLYGTNSYTRRSKREQVLLASKILFNGPDDEDTVSYLNL